MRIGPPNNLGWANVVIMRGASRLASRPTNLLLALGSVALAVRLGLFVDRYAVNIVFWDQWDLLKGLFNGADAWSLFRMQHGPERQGLGNLIIAAVYTATGWNGKADAAASAITMAMAAVAGLWLVKRLCGPLRPWDVVVPLLFLTTTNVETYALAPNIAHGPLPALCLVLYALALTVQSDAARCALVVGINFIAVNSGFTALLGGMTPALLVLFACRPGLTRGGRALYIAGAAAAAASLALFLHGFALVPAVDCFQFPHVRPWEYVPFAGFVLLRPFTVQASALTSDLVIATAAVLGMSGLVATATVQLVRRRGDSALWSAIWTLAGFTVIFACATAVGRVCTGMENAGASRYIPYVVPGWLSLHLLCRSGRPSPRVSTALQSALVIACLLKETGSFAPFEARTHWERKHGWHDCYLRLHNIAACDALVDYPIHPAPAATGLQQKLDWLEARGYSLFQDRDRLIKSAPPE